MFNGLAMSGQFLDVRSVFLFLVSVLELESGVSPEISKSISFGCLKVPPFLHANSGYVRGWPLN